MIKNFIAWLTTGLNAGNDKRTIVFVAADLFVPQGSALSGLDMLRAIPRDRFKIVLISRPSAGQRSQVSQLHFSWFHSIDPNGCILKGNSPLASLRLQLWRIHRLLICWSLKQLNHSDLVIVNGWSSARLWSCVKTPCRAPCALISHEALKYFSTPTCRTPASDYITYSQSFDYDIFVSDILRHQMIEAASLREEKTFHLPNCCEEERFDVINKCDSVEQIRQSIGLPVDRTLLICTGTLTELKGQRDLFLLADQIESILPNFLVVCMGDHGTEFGTSFKQQVRASPWAGSFRFDSPGLYPANWFFAADLMIFPSYTEGLPRSIIEAMAAKLPILSSCVGGIPELIEHRHSGFLFQPGDQHGLLTGLQTLSEDNWKNGRAWAENAYRNFSSRYTRRHFTQRLRRLLDSL